MNEHTGNCGSCRECCSLMKVDLGDGIKPERVPCPHIGGMGCRIYDRRPTACRTWSCLWLLSQDRPDAKMPAAMRPDRSGCVVEVNTAGHLIIHAKKDNSWKVEPMRTWLRKKARLLKVIVQGPTVTALLHADGREEPLRRLGVDGSTNEAVYTTDRSA